MEMTKKKRGRPSQGKGTRAFTLDKDIAAFLDALPEGKRSSFVNEALREYIKSK